MHVIEYLKQHGLEKTKQDFFLETRDYPDRIVFNYTFDSPKHHPITKECRALILSFPDWNVISRAFDRFFNLEEDPDNKNFPFNDMLCLEKVDGSLIPLHNDGKQWQVATRGTAFAEGGTAWENGTFNKTFERAVQANLLKIYPLMKKEDCLNKLFSMLDPVNNYIFELVSPETRVVHPYPNDDCFLLSVRNKLTGIELDWENVKKVSKTIGIKTPKEYTFRTIEECVESSKALPTMDEGYVCVARRQDGTFWRIKVKNPAYLAISNLRCNGALSIKRIAILVFADRGEEYLTYFAEDKPIFLPYIEAYEKMLAAIKELEPLLPMENQKDFAMKVKDTPVGSIMFSLRKGKVLKEILDSMNENVKESILTKFTKK